MIKKIKKFVSNNFIATIIALTFMAWSGALFVAYLFLYGIGGL